MLVMYIFSIWGRVVLVHFQDMGTIFVPGFHILRYMDIVS